MNEDKVVCVIVTYYPAEGPLASLLAALQVQVHAVVVVDNGSPEPARTWLAAHEGPQVHCIFLGENRGIAAAQNIGIRWSIEQGANHVLLFDQDSLPAAGMVDVLLSAAYRQAAAGLAVAAVGPRFLEQRRQNPPPFLQTRGLLIRRLPCDSETAIVPVDHLIASGCLIPVATLTKVGLMQESLFIDYVDIEWGLRAKQHGYQSFGVCGAHMQHDLGDQPIRLAGQDFPARSPLRHYYMLRNATWLYRHAAFPLNWKLADGWRSLLKYGFYSLFARPRLSHWRMMSLGIWHGLTGRLGRLDGQ